MNASAIIIIFIQSCDIIIIHVRIYTASDIHVHISKFSQNCTSQVKFERIFKYHE